MSRNAKTGRSGKTRVTGPVNKKTKKSDVAMGKSVSRRLTGPVDKDVNEFNKVLTPTFSPGEGSVPGHFDLTLTNPQSSVTYKYTIDGSAPTPASTTLVNNQTSLVLTGAPGYLNVKIYGYRNDYAPSDIVDLEYDIKPTQDVVISPPAGQVPNNQLVTLNIENTATGYYTLDGTVPSGGANTVSTRYTGPFVVNFLSPSVTVNTMAEKYDHADSQLTASAYAHDPSIDYSGVYNSVRDLAGKLPSYTPTGSRIPFPSLIFMSTTEGEPITRKTSFWGTDVLVQNSLPSTTDNYISLKAGQNHALALTKSGTVVAWGDDSLNQVTLSNANLTTSGAITDIDAGDSHNLALTTENDIIAWGSNAQGQASVPTNLKAIRIAAGGEHSLALKSDRTVVGWGENTDGQINFPMNLNDVVEISAGQNHSAALVGYGTKTYESLKYVDNEWKIVSESRPISKAVAWGINDANQTNVPNSLKNGTPDLVAISCGGNHTLVLNANGDISAWGDNGFGQVTIPTLNELDGSKAYIVSIDAGFSHSLALSKNGTVFVWGSNQNNQLEITNLLSNSVLVAGGDNYSMAFGLEPNEHIYYDETAVGLGTLVPPSTTQANYTVDASDCQSESSSVVFTSDFHTWDTAKVYRFQTTAAGGSAGYTNGQVFCINGSAIASTSNAAVDNTYYYAYTGAGSTFTGKYYQYDSCAECLAGGAGPNAYELTQNIPETLYTGAINIGLDTTLVAVSVDKATQAASNLSIHTYNQQKLSPIESAGIVSSRGTLQPLEEGTVNPATFTPKRLFAVKITGEDVDKQPSVVYQLTHPGTYTYPSADLLNDDATEKRFSSTLLEGDIDKVYDGNKSLNNYIAFSRGGFVGYKFEDPKRVTKISFATNADDYHKLGAGVIQGSNDNVNWDDIDFFSNKFPDNYPAFLSLEGEALDRLASLKMTSSGAGYSSDPIIRFILAMGQEGEGAKAKALFAPFGLAGFQMVEGGTGYNDIPIATMTSVDGGAGASGTAVLTAERVVHGISLDFDDSQGGCPPTPYPCTGYEGEGYTSTPIVTISGVDNNSAPTSSSAFGAGATAVAYLTPTQITGVEIIEHGVPYRTAPSVGFTDGGGQGAAATALLTAFSVGGLNSSGLIIGNVNYDPPYGYHVYDGVGVPGIGSPTIGSFGGGGGYGGGNADLVPTGVFKLDHFDIDNVGVGYTSAPTVSLAGGTITQPNRMYAVKITVGDRGPTSGQHIESAIDQGFVDGVLPLQPWHDEKLDLDELQNHAYHSGILRDHSLNYGTGASDLYRYFDNNFKNRLSGQWDVITPFRVFFDYANYEAHWYGGFTGAGHIPYNSNTPFSGEFEHGLPGNPAGCVVGGGGTVAQGACHSTPGNLLYSQNSATSRLYRLKFHKDSATQQRIDITGGGGQGMGGYVELRNHNEILGFTDDDSLLDKLLCLYSHPDVLNSSANVNAHDINDISYEELLWSTTVSKGGLLPDDDATLIPYKLHITGLGNGYTSAPTITEEFDRSFPGMMFMIEPTGATFRSGDGINANNHDWEDAALHALEDPAGRNPYSGNGWKCLWGSGVSSAGAPIASSSNPAGICASSLTGVYYSDGGSYPNYIGSSGYYLANKYLSSSDNDRMQIPFPEQGEATYVSPEGGGHPFFDHMRIGRVLGMTNGSNTSASNAQEALWALGVDWRLGAAPPLPRWADTSASAFAFGPLPQNGYASNPEGWKDNFSQYRGHGYVDKLICYFPETTCDPGSSAYCFPEKTGYGYINVPDAGGSTNPTSGIESITMLDWGKGYGGTNPCNTSSCHMVITTAKTGLNNDFYNYNSDYPEIDAPDFDFRSLPIVKEAYWEHNTGQFDSGNGCTFDTLYRGMWYCGVRKLAWSYVGGDWNTQTYGHQSCTACGYPKDVYSKGIHSDETQTTRPHEQIEFFVPDLELTKMHTNDMYSATSANRINFETKLGEWVNIEALMPEHSKVEAFLTSGDLDRIEMTNFGTGYTNDPLVVFSGGTTAAPATGKALLSHSVSGINLDGGGAGYRAFPDITLTAAAGDEGAGAIAVGTKAPSNLTGLLLSSGGKNYTNAPIVDISGGGSVDEANQAQNGINRSYAASYYNHKIGPVGYRFESTYHDFKADKFYMFNSNGTESGHLNARPVPGVSSRGTQMNGVIGEYINCVKGSVLSLCPAQGCSFPYRGMDYGLQGASGELDSGHYLVGPIPGVITGNISSGGFREYDSDGDCLVAGALILQAGWTNGWLTGWADLDLAGGAGESFPTEYASAIARLPVALSSATFTNNNFYNNYRIIGQGDSVLLNTQVNELEYYSGDSRVSKYSNRKDHSLTIKSNRELVSWGDNSNSQLMSSGVTNAQDVSAGDKHSLVLKTNGTVIAFGNNDYGQCNITNDLNNVISVSAGENHSLGLLAGGIVRAWGRNHSGQIDVPTPLTSYQSGDRGAISTKAGNNHSLALLGDGRITGWGAPIGVTGIPSGLDDVMEIAAGRDFGLALKRNGDVVGWGSLSNVEKAANVPSDLKDVVSIAACNDHALALQVDGSVTGWGTVWDGSASVSFSDTIPGGINTGIGIFAGKDHGTILKSDGSLLVFGSICDSGAEAYYDGIVPSAYGSDNCCGTVGFVTFDLGNLYDSQLDTNENLAYRSAEISTKTTPDAAFPPDIAGLQNKVRIVTQVTGYGYVDSDTVTGEYPLVKLGPIVSAETNASYGPDITIPNWDQDSVGDLTVRYTTDGTDPSGGSTYNFVTLVPNSGDFIHTLTTSEFNNSTTLKVYAFSDVYLDSEIVQYQRQQLSAPTVSIAATGSNTLIITMNATVPSPETRSANIYYTLDGTAPSSSSYLYSSPINIQGSSITVKAYSSLIGYIDSSITTETHP
jgi:alpha-tubulin suppressor-like RCC1 family protein